MTGVLLFCTAEEAKSFIHKVLDVKLNAGSQSVRIFYLVGSNVCPSDKEGFRSELKENDTFETDFLGASERDCQNWALEKQFQVNFIQQDLIAIADSRSAKDGTLLLKYYSHNITPAPEFGEFGALPKERNTWYDFRIDYQGAPDVSTDLFYGPPETVYPAYFGRKAELTDERGVFDVAKATRLVIGEDPDTVLGGKR